MGLLDRLFGTRGPDPRDAFRPAYARIVERARRPQWYLAGVPDTLDGRFDVLSTIVSLTLLAWERDPARTTDGSRLTELFVDDMDGQLRQIGVGDMIVGKHVGRMMSALGGRLQALRDAGDDVEALKGVATRNLLGGDATHADEVARLLASERQRIFAGELG